MGFPGGSEMVKNPPALRETWVPPLGGEDPLEEGMASPSTVLAWDKNSEFREHKSLDG